MTPQDADYPGGAPTAPDAGDCTGSDMHPSLQVAGMPPGIVLDQICKLLGNLRTEPTNDGGMTFGFSGQSGLFGQAFMDGLRLFRGRYPGFQACNTLYHDLDHTLSVVLATARLIHGAVVAGLSFAPRDVELTMLAALFHDVGYIQQDDDNIGSGAKFTVGHEERGIELMLRYLRENSLHEDFTDEELGDCANMVRCTNLAVDCTGLRFYSARRCKLGHMLGTADLLAQMADRRYLEKLFYLYREFSEADIREFESEIDLLRKTRGFYEHVARKRMENDFGSVSEFMTTHFSSIGCCNPYTAYIDKNLNYLQTVLERWQGSFKDLLRRNVPSTF